MLTSQTIVSIDLRCLIMVSIMIMIVVVFMALLVIMAVMVMIMVFMIVMVMIIVMMIIMVVMMSVTLKVVMVHAEVADKVPAEGVVTGPGPGHQVLVLSQDIHQPLQPKAGQTQQEVGSLLNRKWNLEP